MIIRLASMSNNTEACTAQQEIRRGLGEVDEKFAL